MSMIRLLFLSNLWQIVYNSDAKCRERTRLIDNEKSDLYAVTDAILGQKLVLECNHCNENDDGKPKIWYKMNDFKHLVSREVPLDMNNNSSLNKIQLKANHNLVIKSFEKNDTGLYHCQRLEESEQEKYNYLIDLVYDENVTAIETGNMTAWRKYFDDYFLPINMLLKESNGVEFEYLRDKLKIQCELVTQWGPWGVCQVCGRPQNEGVKKKTGLCRIKLTPVGDTTTANADEDYLKYANAISCRSKTLERIFPGISNLTRIIPDFLQVQSCEGICNPDAEGMGKGWKTGKTAAFKYKKSLVLDEGSHLTLTCPESTLETTVIWRKTGKTLVPGIHPDSSEEVHLLVDTFNTLYLIDVRETEAGNYTCQVNDIRMQQTTIFIVSKSKLLTQVFGRNMMYLGMILCLTLPCYCAGIIIACSRKRYFKSYDEISEETQNLL